MAQLGFAHSIEKANKVPKLSYLLKLIVKKFITMLGGEFDGPTIASRKESRHI